MKKCFCLIRRIQAFIIDLMFVRKNSGILLDIFQIMKNTEKKNLGDAGFKGLCKPLWKKEYPNWKEDFNNFKKNIQREKESDIMRQRFKTRMRYDRSRIEG